VVEEEECEESKVVFWSRASRSVLPVVRSFPSTLGQEEVHRSPRRVRRRRRRLDRDWEAMSPQTSAGERSGKSK
jgi:hypothetical protein